MLCSQCGKELKPDDKYCSDCGNRLEPEVSQQSPKSLSNEPPLNQAIVKKKPMPMWFKLITFLTVLALISVTAAILFTETLVDVVDDQLEALRKGEIAKAYNDYTSQDFQASTTFDQFKNFIEAYPVFHNNQSAHFFQRSLKDHIIILKGHLISDNNIDTPIEYKIIQENKKWKILSMRLLKPDSISRTETLLEKTALVEVVKAQLDKIEQHMDDSAYNDFSSKEFMQATSRSVFQDFINRYLVREKPPTISFQKTTIHNGVGTVTVVIDNSETASYVKYYLIYENGQWKIWSMRALSSSENSAEKKEIIEKTP